MLDAGEIERVAEAVHRRFRADTPLEPGHPADVGWDELPDALRDQNRDQAAANVRRLHAAGYRLVPLAEAGPDRVTSLPDALVEDLALDEHQRWSATKVRQGYRWGPERSDAAADLRHPDLVPWDELDEPAKEKDRRPMRDLVALFADAGWAVVATRFTDP